MPRSNSNLMQNFREAKDDVRRGYGMDYSGATPSTFRRKRTGLGGGADAHYYSEARYFQMIEYVRDMERNDWLIGTILDRLVDNVIRNGFDPEFDTGDKKIDKDLWDRQDAWAKDPRQCDVAQQLTFVDQQKLAFRERVGDGDIFTIPITDPNDESYGAIQMLEGDCCRTPTTSKKQIVHGIEIDDRRRPVRYYFVRKTTEPFSRTIRVKDTTPIDATDEDGNPQVFHCRKPSRVSQTRGVTAFKGCFDLAGIADDIHFSEVIRRQIAAAVGLAIETTADAPNGGGHPQFGDRTTETLPNGFNDVVDKIAPGMILRLAKGQKATMLGTNLPGDGFIPHFRMVIQSIGACVSMPLIVILLDAGETNFSGWRGAMDQAKIAFVCEQYLQETTFCRPVLNANIRRWLNDDPILAKAAHVDGINVFRHTWHYPGWPYVQPLQDAQAGMVRVNTGQTSPRRVAAENGDDFETICDESVADTERWIGLAMEATQRLRLRFGELAKDLHWSHLYHRDFPRGVQVIDSVDEQQPQKKSEKASQTNTK